MGEAGEAKACPRWISQHCAHVHDAFCLAAALAAVHPAHLLVVAAGHGLVLLQQALRQLGLLLQRTLQHELLIGQLINVLLQRLELVRAATREQGGQAG